MFGETENMLATSVCRLCCFLSSNEGNDNLHNLILIMF